ncbi:hypothetical protein TSUD_400610 [Trifolium subterraneum]|uniref:Uncharacterized protein n=1 Tax=Trifolium subterraneum TaxID=3900 RepID=A0A2Z6NS30_TRISU|nr:hypothetical protein TSUD_400610 [Trifolium subterraneum]
MFGFPYSSSNSESSSDSDGSGNDSDCVIISPSSFNSKNPNNRSLIVADSVATISTSMETSSRFTSDEFVSTFRKVIKVSGLDSENRVIVDPVAEGDSQPNRGRFALFASNFKNYKDTFVRFRCGEECPKLMFDASGKPLFPFYWSSAVKTLNEYERDVVGFLTSMSTLSAQRKAALVLTAREQKAQAVVAAASADAMAQLDEGGAKGTKRKNQEESSQISIEIPKKKKTANAEEEGEDDGEPFFWTKDFDSMSYVDEGFKKFARSSIISELDFEDLRKAAMDCHIQGALLSYYLSTRQELESIDARNKMEAADSSLSSLEKEYATVKTKLEGDLKEMKVWQEEAVKVAVKAKDDEIDSLKEKAKSLEGKHVVATKERDEANSRRDEMSKEIDVLTAQVGNLELEMATQYNDEFKFAVDQMKVVYPDVDAAKLGGLDSLNQIVDGKLVPYTSPGSI